MGYGLLEIEHILLPRVLNRDHLVLERLCMIGLRQERGAARFAHSPPNKAEEARDVLFGDAELVQLSLGRIRTCLTRDRDVSEDARRRLGSQVHGRSDGQLEQQPLDVVDQPTRDRGKPDVRVRTPDEIRGAVRTEQALQESHGGLLGGPEQRPRHPPFVGLPRPSPRPPDRSQPAPRSHPRTKPKSSDPPAGNRNFCPSVAAASATFVASRGNESFSANPPSPDCSNTRSPSSRADTDRQPSGVRNRGSAVARIEYPECVAPRYTALTPGLHPQRAFARKVASCTRPSDV